jgi:hypothetical protein
MYFTSSPDPLGITRSMNSSAEDDAQGHSEGRISDTIKIIVYSTYGVFVETENDITNPRVYQ